MYIYIYTYIYIWLSYSQSQVSIGMRHVFSAEIDNAKRNYLLEAFEDVEHLFGDVSCFSETSGWCYKCNETHQIGSNCIIDLLLAGPSCKDISPLAYFFLSGWGNMHIYIYMHKGYIYIYAYEFAYAYIYIYKYLCISYAYIYIYTYALILSIPLSPANVCTPRHAEPCTVFLRWLLL